MSAIIECAICGATRQQPATRAGEPRVPAGWKRLRTGTYCQTCKVRAYALRTITIPIAGPVDGTWAELRDALRVAWSASTACANWMMTELYARDVRRQPGMVRLP